MNSQWRSASTLDSMRTARLQPFFFALNDLDHPINKAFCSVIEEVQKGLPIITQFGPDAALVRDFLRNHGRDPEKTLDYERYAVGFNQASFFKNLYKALAFLWQLRSVVPVEYPLVDIGCGAGVFTIAWDRIIRAPPCTTVLIDRSAAQLDIACRLLPAVGITDYRTQLGTYPGDFADVRGLRLFSYFFCKQVFPPGPTGTAELSSWLGTTALIIDYEHVIDSLARRIGGCCDVVNLRLSPPGEIAGLFNDQAFNACGLVFRG